MQKQLFFIGAILVLVTPFYSRGQNTKPANGGARPAAGENGREDRIHREINKLINQIEMLKKENEELKKSHRVDNKIGTESLNTQNVADLLKGIDDQSQEYDIMTDSLKDIAQEEDKKQQEIDALKKQVEYLGNGWVNTLKTIEANIKSAEFSKVLSKSLVKLDDASIAKKINEALANAVYRLKFMYTESNYILSWMNKKINWKAAQAKGITIPAFTKDLTDDQIKKMVMAVEVK